MVKKAVIPAAGFGTRLLPATKSQPKEMMPIVDKPAIQYVVEEAVASGITDILMVIGKGKRAIEEHFDRSYELEHRLEAQGRTKELKLVKQISELADIHFIWQKELRGLGDAILHAKAHVGNEPFAVLLGDTIISTYIKPLTLQLMEIYEQLNEPVFALQEVDPAIVSRYGVFGGREISENLFQATELVEKPATEKAPSNLVMAGRYVFTPDIFPLLESAKPGVNNEIQLTDAMKALMQQRELYGWKFNGQRFDVGDKLDFIKTNITMALKREDLSEDLKDWLKSLTDNL